MCSGCCRDWNVIVTEAEAARFKDHPWAVDRQRFSGRELMERTGDNQLRLSHIGDACIFLDDDNLCAIHKELGYDAKPRMCRQFPYYPVDTPDGIVGTLDFACPAVVADKGAPVQEQEEEFRQTIAESGSTGKSPARVMGLARLPFGPSASRLEARRGVPLAWADYAALERGLLHILQDASRPLSERLDLLDRVAAEAPEHAASGAMAAWIQSLRQADWAPLAAPRRAARVSPLRQRAVIAPVIGGVEDGWRKGLGGRTSTAARVSLALAIVPSQRLIRLNTADATLDLARMSRTRFAQDDPALSQSLVRFLIAFNVRKGLIDGTSVLQGSRYLAVYFAMIRWYSVARAVLAERDAVAEADVHYAIGLAEKTLSHAQGLKSPGTMRMLNLLFDHVAPARSLYPNPYPT